MTAFAVMEDDTILCPDCADETRDERLPATAATLVHAWLPTGSDEVCSCCGASDDDDRAGS
jgi:hypothetical protein